MKQPLDISIGQRLAIGFGLALLMLAVFIGLVMHWNARSVRAETALIEREIPLVTGISNMKYAILNVGIGTRAYLLRSSPERRQQHQSLVDIARATMGRLNEQPKDGEGEALYREAAARIGEFLQQASRLVGQGAAAPARAEEEALVDARAAAVESLHNFAAYQDRRLHAGIAAMAGARNNVTDGLFAASALVALFFMVIGYFTVQSIRRPAKGLQRVAAALEAGDWRPALAWAPPKNGNGRARPAARNEIVSIGRAFGAAAVALESREQRMRADGEVAAAAASSLQKEQIAENALHGIVRHVGADVGVMYWRERDSDTLAPIARHALDEQAGPIRIGEGLPGQAAREGRALVSRDIPRDSQFAVRLGYDQAPPKAVAAVPIVFGRELRGAMVVASLRDIDEHALSFLRAAGAQLGIGFQNVRAHEETERLLAQVREQNERIQAQNEELQAQNEEIQAQSEEIQAQSEEIQAQAEEIQAQNEELKQQAEGLRVHAGNLAEAAERKNEFLGILAHELRNPLAAITNSLIIARRTPPGSEQSLRAQAVIERQAQQLVRLIDDLLDITRISQGKIRIQRDRLDLAEVVRTCVEDQRAALEAADLTVDFDLPDGEVWVEGDRARLCQVLGNLLNNAIKFTDRGNNIVLALRPQPQSGQVAIHVIDSGVGIDPDFVPQLFQPFQQAKIGTRRANTGLGLGLALVKELTELHHGSVEARSEGEGRGAEFIVRLPLALDAAGARAGQNTAGAGRRILVVEDNADVAQTLRDVLELEGHSVVVAASGAEALERARVLRPHVVLCDIGLPGMDGYEVARRLREDARVQPALVIALTGYTSTLDKERAAQAGFDQHLSKPPSIEQLREILAAIE